MAVLGVSMATRDPVNGPEQESKASAAELDRQRSLIEATLDAIGEGVLVVDNEGNVVDHNDLFLEMWRIPEKLAEAGVDEALLAHVQDQLVDPEGFLQRVEELYGDPDAVSHDRIRFNDGRVFERASRPQKVDGETVGRVWTFRDITDELEAKQRLQESNELLDSYASVISHDLREPLRKVVTQLEMLDRHLDGIPEDERNRIRSVREGAQEAQERIEGLHRLASLERGQLETEPVDLETLLDEVARGLEDSLEEVDARLEVGKLPTVQADRAQLADLFQNLVENALRYRLEEPPVIEIRSNPVGSGRHRIEVADNGKGIPPEHQHRIFDLFATSGGSTGTGIGLALCRRVVRGHGGEIDVDSAPGEGSAFRFTLPGADATPD